MKIASVPYFNAKPLIYGLKDVMLAHPTELARKLRGGEVDVGLVPVMEVLEQPQLYDVLDGFSISSRGPVRSVILAHRIPLEKISRISVDIHSKTSAALVRVVCARFLGLEPDYFPLENLAPTAEQEAVMLIGDQALKFLSTTGSHGWQIMDLGTLWKEKTGLPFVYAVWAARKGVCDFGLFELLRRAKDAGLSNLQTICAGGHELTSQEEAMEYLTRNIFYDLDEPEKEGIDLFRSFLDETGLSNEDSPVKYLNFD